MELTYVTIVVLASMMFALSGMVGYVYWQQTRMLQHIQSLSAVLSTHFVPYTEPEPEPEPIPSPPEEEEEDDRVSVEEKVENVEGPVDVDDIQGKTVVQLRELLSQKGIPYGKRDSKTVLLQLLKATS
jgi:hypothetical protein